MCYYTCNSLIRSIDPCHLSLLATHMDLCTELAILSQSSQTRYASRPLSLFPTNRRHSFATERIESSGIWFKSLILTLEEPLLFSVFSFLWIVRDCELCIEFCWVSSVSLDLGNLYYRSEIPGLLATNIFFSKHIMLVHRSVIRVCFTTLTNTELAGINTRLLFFHTAVVTVCGLDPCQVLQNRA